MADRYLRWFEELTIHDIPHVGGKNASLGEMITALTRQGIRVPGGFATTADAYREFLHTNGLAERIYAALDKLNDKDVSALAQTGKLIRRWVSETPLPPALLAAVSSAYQELIKRYGATASFAVRSSATAEDLPEASFAGQQETLLNIRGEPQLHSALLQIFASLFTDRAISYRMHHGFDHRQVALSVGVQKMVRSDLAASGVIFTLDTESGFNDVVFITSAYGLGETVVQGSVNPDEFYVYKPNLIENRPAILRRQLGSKASRLIFADTDTHNRSTKLMDVPPEQQQRFSISNEDVNQLARLAIQIERHYGKPMDIEWAKDGQDGELYIVQARPETVKSRTQQHVLKRYELKSRSDILSRGRSIGQRIGTGHARVIQSAQQLDRVNEGDVLITDMTDPDWEPIMKRAAAIVTNRGGRTCHAAIVARELGIPALVGCGNATETIRDGLDVTVSCAEGDTGFVYAGKQAFEIKEVNLGSMPKLPFKMMLNVGNPERAFDFRFLPNHGVGLARLEFIINVMIGIHPKAILEYDRQPVAIQQKIIQHSGGYSDPVSFYIDKLAEGIATIAAAFAPKPVIVRLSDFKSNEYANLIGGVDYEPKEENPMLGFRGASRYLDNTFHDCFELECKAINYVRRDMQLKNVWVMVPFVRSVEEARRISELLTRSGLQRQHDDLKIMMMCEIPSNALLAEEFLNYFDGFSIGSNDLTQLTLGLDRDSALIAEAFDERNPAVKKLLCMAIAACRAQGKYIGICGQGPSDHPDLALWLMQQGIESISLNPDSVVETWLYLAKRLDEHTLVD